MDLRRPQFSWPTFQWRNMDSPLSKFTDKKGRLKFNWLCHSIASLTLTLILLTNDKNPKAHKNSLFFKLWANLLATVSHYVRLPKEQLSGLFC